MTVGEMTVGETTRWRNDSLAKRLVGEMTVGETTRWRNKIFFSGALCYKAGAPLPEPENKQFEHAHIQSIYTSVPDVWLVGREMDRKHTLRVLYHMPNMILRPTIIRNVLRTKPPQNHLFPSVEVNINHLAISLSRGK